MLILSLVLSLRALAPSDAQAGAGLRLRIVSAEIGKATIEVKAAISNRGSRPVRIYDPSAYATVEGLCRLPRRDGSAPLPKTVDVGYAAYRTKTIMPGGRLAFSYAQATPRLSQARGARAWFRLRYDSTYAVSRFEENGWPRKPSRVVLLSPQVPIEFVDGRARVRFRSG